MELDFLIFRITLLRLALRIRTKVHFGAVSPFSVAGVLMPDTCNLFDFAIGLWVRCLQPGSAEAASSEFGPVF